MKGKEKLTMEIKMEEGMKRKKGKSLKEEVKRAGNIDRGDIEKY